MQTIDDMTDSNDVYPDAAVAPGYLANHAARLFNRQVDTALRPYGLTMALISPLLLLSWKGPLLQRDLVRWSAVKQPAMAALLDKLEAMDFVTRTTSTTDRRAASVRLTEAGHDAARIGGDALIAANQRGLAGFSDSEATGLVTLLQRFIANYEAADGTIHHA
ncbi:MarR family winged helix-turn-helix transcriptional regulator [Sphingomonas sp. 22176]